MALHNRSDDKSWKIMSSLWQILYKERYYEPSCKEDSQVIHNTAFLFFIMLRYSVTCCCPYLIYIYDRPIYGCFTMIIICADPWYPLSWSIQYKLRIYTEILCHECFQCASPDHIYSQFACLKWMFVPWVLLHFLIEAHIICN